MAGKLGWERAEGRLERQERAQSTMLASHPLGVFRPGLNCSFRNQLIMIVFTHKKRITAVRAMLVQGVASRPESQGP